MDVTERIRQIYNIREERDKDPSHWRTKCIACWLDGFREIIGEDRLDMPKVEKYCMDKKKQHKAFLEILADRVKLGGIKDYAEFYHYPLGDFHHIQTLIVSENNKGRLHGRNYDLDGKIISLPIIHLKMSYPTNVDNTDLISGFHDLEPWRQLDVPNLTRKGYESFQELVDYAKL
jgi:hypothetical protein